MSRHTPVAVSSTADDAYTQQKFGASAAKPESYLFFRGKFYEGATRDADLEHAQFNSIVQVLGKDLAKQNYFPSTDIKDADLLIVVHWGTTVVYQQDFIDTWALPKQPFMREVDSSTAHDADHQMLALDHGAQWDSFTANARLLGLNQQLSVEQAKKAGDYTADEVELFHNVDRERYFVILMAYDYRTMKKGVPPKLLWSTRFSVKSPGNSFTAALPLMSEAAADYFGHSEGMKAVKPRTSPVGTVKLGPLDIIGEEPKGEKTGAAAASPDRK